MTITPSGQSRVEGVRLALRLVEPADAGYIHGLRTNPAYNEHLSAVTGTADDQRAWIERYKAREAEGQEYYYVIERLSDGHACGTVRLYDIEADRFTWGSWILDHNKPRKAALESALLIYLVAFDLLELSEAVFDVRRENNRTSAFHRRFGATETHEDEQDVFFVYPRSRFDTDRASYFRVLTREEGDE